MEQINPNQLNEYVRDILSPYLCGDFQLTPIGQDKVFQANTELGETYAKGHYLPVADWCFKDIERKLKALPPFKFGTVLDVCAGTGYISLNVMRHGTFKKCVALDINPSALRILEQRARELDVANIECRVGNIFATEFAAESFDCVMGNAFLHHLPDTQMFFKEMHRVLKAGGVLCLTGEPGVSTMKWENLIPRLLKRLFGKRHWPKGEIPLTDIWQFDKKAITKALQESGFNEVRVTGFGRWSSSMATFLNRLWVRFTGYSAPQGVLYFFYLLQKLDFASDPDQCAAVSIAARKAP